MTLRAVLHRIQSAEPAIGLAGAGMIYVVNEQVIAGADRRRRGGYVWSLIAVGVHWVCAYAGIWLVANQASIDPEWGSGPTDGVVALILLIATSVTALTGVALTWLLLRRFDLHRSVLVPVALVWGLVSAYLFMRGHYAYVWAPDFGSAFT